MTILPENMLREMLHTATVAPTVSMELRGLMRAPEETWDLQRRFVGLGPEDLDAMAATSEILLRNAADFVIAAYDHLREFPETAAILGWEQEVDEEHLAERRRFFAVWMGRTIGLDLSADFARYLFHAGRLHAGHGPRQVNVDDLFITGTMSLILGAFADWMHQARLDLATTTKALTGWNKYLLMQLQVMLDGARAARALDEGHLVVHVSIFGRLRSLLHTANLDVHVNEGDTVADVLRKFFDYYPEAREEALESEWVSEKEDATWVTDLERVYRPKRYWNVLLNGKDVRFHGGFTAPVHDGDTLSIFPPGR